jgi:hypothetical protein
MLKKSSNGNRSALSRKLDIKKGKENQKKKKVTLSELETKWTLEHNEVVAVWQWPDP